MSYGYIQNTAQPESAWKYSPLPPIFNIPLKTNIKEYNNNNVIEHSKKGFINTSFDHGESSGRGHRAQSSLQPQPMYGIKYEESQPGYCALKKNIQFKWLCSRAKLKENMANTMYLQYRNIFKCPLFNGEHHE